ncbi:hypothetical protein ACOME3_000934 [Neoechinorhynchus agilis]
MSSDKGSRETSVEQSEHYIEQSILRLLAPTNCLGAIIGHRGENVNDTSAESGTKIDIIRDDPAAGHLETLIEIRGRSTESISIAVRRILEDVYRKILSKWHKRLSRSDGLGENDELSETSIRRRIVNFYLKFLVSNDLVGQIIGKEGRNITSMREQTDTHISVSTIKFNHCHFLTRSLFVKQVENDIEKIVRAFSQIFEKIRSIRKRSIELSDHHQNFEIAVPQQLQTPSSISYRISDREQDMSILASWLSQLQAAQLLPPTPQNLSFTSQQPATYVVNQSMFPQQINPDLQNNSTGITASSSNGMVTNPFPRCYPPNPYLNPKTQRLNRNESVIIHIPYFAAGVIIGRRGASIRHIIKSTGATIRISPDNRETLNAEESDLNSYRMSGHSRQVMIRGKPEAQFRAQYTIFHMLTTCGFTGHHFDKFIEILGENMSENVMTNSLRSHSRDIVLVVELCVPYESVGRIIGKKGARIRSIERGTGALVRFVSDAAKKVESVPESQLLDPTIPEVSYCERSDDIRKEEELLFATVYIIGSFNCCYAAQRYIRQIVDDNGRNNLRRDVKVDKEITEHYVPNGGVVSN